MIIVRQAARRLLRCAAGLLSLTALLLLVACGTNSNSAAGGVSASASATPTCPPTPRFQSVSGTVQSVSTGSFTVLDRQGQSKQVVYTSSTRFTKQVQEKVSDLKEGEQVTVFVSQNSDGTYSAVSIAAGSGQAGFASNGNGTGRNGQGSRQGFGGNRGSFNAACFRRQSQGVSGANGTSSQNSRAVRGSITQIAGNQLTVTDSSGSNFVLTLTSTTRIVETEAASASDLKSGVTVLVVGSNGSQGQLTASSVTINPQMQGR
ncbi:MAG: hypothetical protein IMW90_16020 [Thermogemmatispora sp.]|jgi:ABC-type Fe3+-hydroxamate transport system substrate-binding protein|uniref:DUF5666 domain-containing protein n=1 Tax=Thermogemmatispora aurantia TaxID=2045279 RepID=A0A5J4KE20_9CHLR|nr:MULTISPECIES: DUF5666 domain-containing protein [Thermogemmatispora]MBE3567225.1 hypothetical protein [Thermogemmatispora sp.]GER84691.1 hypothetical protein KTAU_33270 [Thermogemmatispora aurantia]